MEIDDKLLDNPTAPNDLCVSVFHGQPKYSFDINKSVIAATAAVSLAVVSLPNFNECHNFNPIYLQSDIPAIELYIDNTGYRNLRVSDIVNQVLSFYGLGKTHLCSIAGISRPALYAWLDNSAVPDEKNFSKIKTLYNIAENISNESEDGILWAVLQRPIEKLGMSLYDLFVCNTNLDTLEIIDYVKQAYEESVEYRNHLAEWKKKSFNNAHSMEEQELNLEDNI